MCSITVHDSSIYSVYVLYVGRVGVRDRERGKERAASMGMGE